VVLLMAYIGGVGYFVGPIFGAIIVTFLQINLSDLTTAWQLYFGLLFIAVVSFAPGGVAGWLMRHFEAARSGAFLRLAPAYAMVAPGLAVGLIGAVALIELANRQLALARSEGSAMNLFGFAVDASTVAPWATVIALTAGGAAATWALWPKVDDAWSAVNAGLRARGRA